MTREAFAEYIHWNWYIGFIGFVNIVSLVPQIRQTIRTRKVNEISLMTFVIIFVIQVSFAIEGFFRNSPTILWSNGIAACTNTLLISLVLYFRRKQSRQM